MIIEEVLKKNMHLALSWNSVTGCLPWLSTCKKRFTTEKAVQVVEMRPFTKHSEAGSILIKRKCHFFFNFRLLFLSALHLTPNLQQIILPLDSQRNTGNCSLRIPSISIPTTHKCSIPLPLPMYPLYYT